VDARELDLPVPLDRKGYRDAVELLTERGLIEHGRLTRYGREVERCRSSDRGASSCITPIPISCRWWRSRRVANRCTA